ncbi:MULTISPECIES: MarR family winged helix-turn-helix transcriptional regulator [Chryseobacterium]|uniref:DNA-binding MarR family transcriptional regulator n=1 Tax=Chryseobacterium camelliae TaxID=1265445 RepID=A0ABU0TIF3_9FLAO|nr:MULTISPECIES: winged helix DNA-binding protein [Chryseobacterium]MDT3409297.1 DNA-binding MarR family transcriptional regulator [Pseudacidovorax intermedius]MDQ1096839.1 DNA-binding MarR family transcriptional regulator [Chryseobacterium camelliae]MDQ1100780.1 DNA-binding MarR family transcriptional regulator [Chryseobacterium sp. SORGH_AS_1048]MDR6084224.1 DNA-binding MarR family transcriptional regulator [Chryseobacterium sp. SORGH_AS_0909]MDR6132496.1 DNA-binding MarR family transcriptio
MEDDIINIEIGYGFISGQEAGKRRRRNKVFSAIECSGHEKLTGTQILKRLLDYGLIEERHDEADKRSKTLKLTEKGEAMFHQSVEKVDMTSQVLSGSLNEKDQLLVLLRKLNEFHAHLYSEHKNSEVTRIFELIR